MAGKSAVTVLNDGTNTNKNLDVSLNRGVAKIRVNLSYGTDYQPTGQVTKKLVNYAYDTAGCWKAATPIRPPLPRLRPIRIRMPFREMRIKSSSIHTQTTGTAQ